MPSAILRRWPITLAFFAAVTFSQAQLSADIPLRRSNSIVAVGSVNFGSVQQQSFDSFVRDSAGAQILRDEAPIIRNIEIVMHEGRDMERNLTAVRDAIRQELVNANDIGHIGRIKVDRRLRELDFRINQLRIKNNLCEQKLQAFISGIASGKIRDRWAARRVLNSIYIFCRKVIGTLVSVCRQLTVGVMNILFGQGNAIGSLVGLKRRKLEAGINLIAGI